MVPVLIGMGFLGKNGAGMMIDFNTGLAMSTTDANPEIYQLQANSKGHFVLNIVHHLTRGQSRLEGHAHVVVRAPTASSSETHDTQVLELGAVWFDMTARDRELEAADLDLARQRMWQLYASSQQSFATATAASAQMCRSQPAIASSTSSTCSPRDGDGGLRACSLREDCRGRDQVKDSQGQSSAIGHESASPRRHQGSPGQVESVAMLQPAHCRHSEEQQPRAMDSLQRVQPEAGLHAPPREENPAMVLRRISSSHSWEIASLPQRSISRCRRRSTPRRS